MSDLPAKDLQESRQEAHAGYDEGGKGNHVVAPRQLVRRIRERSLCSNLTLDHGSLERGREGKPHLLMPGRIGGRRLHHPACSGKCLQVGLLFHKAIHNEATKVVGIQGAKLIYGPGNTPSLLFVRSELHA